MSRVLLVRCGRSLHKLDLVTIRILDEGNDRLSMFHGSWWTAYLTAIARDRGAGRLGILDLDRDVPKACSPFVARHIPVVGELQDRLFALGSIADKGEGKATFGVVFAPQKSHAKRAFIELERPVQVGHSQHGVGYAHPLSRLVKRVLVYLNSHSEAVTETAECVTEGP